MRHARTLFAFACLSILLAAPLGLAGDEPKPSAKLREHVTAVGAMEHLSAFEMHANSAGGRRLPGFAGADASADHIAAHAAAAGLVVTEQEYQFHHNGPIAPATFQQISPFAQSYGERAHFAVMVGSGSGDVTAQLVAVDLTIPLPGPSQGTSGCEAGDFVGFPAGSIALIQRGTCTFRVKTELAAAAGAVGVVIFNDGAPGREGLFFGTLGDPALTTPTIGTTYALGAALAGGVSNGPTGVVVRLATTTFDGTLTSTNVIASTPKGDPESVIVLYAEYPSGVWGPGINEASGAAALLELAESYQEVGKTPKNQLRFVWLGAQSTTPLNAYLSSLTPAELGAIKAAIGVGPVGSSNFARLVQDGDGSALPPMMPPPGSAALEMSFHDTFAALGVAAAEDPDAIRGWMDWAALGVPVGGVTAGFMRFKTPDEAALFGGTADVLLDPCATSACDTTANVHAPVLDEMLDALAHVATKLARRDLAKEPLA